MRDDSALIDLVKPPAIIMGLCDHPTIEAQISNAAQQREDYLDDSNYLKYLKSLWDPRDTKTPGELW